MSSSQTWRSSVTVPTLSAIRFNDGRQPPGKMWVLAKLFDAFSTSKRRSSMVIACSRKRPSSASSRSQALKYASKYCQPTASIISTETSRS